ncbi:IclR family transcriptional regulator [Bacillus massiliigorillae]|uniref:IclR family transcriptional regulator n=1 Tax=Bacillus massiliigorillae TaxID=1243664 RepID=UPI0003A12D7D|nr:IclR family transcriptional regulator [Bacillus massiliigorillae]
MSKEDSMQTISRAITILKAFSREDKELSLADLHRKLGLSKSSLQRILNTLMQYGLIEKSEERKTYQLGMELYFLGNLVEMNSSLLSIAKPYMSRLNNIFNETVSLSIIDHNQRKCIGYVASHHELRSLTYIGQYSPLYAGASAKCLMAFLSDDELATLLQSIDLKPITQETIIDRQCLQQELRTIRQQGYAISNGERVIGAFSISAPIMDRFQQILATVSLMIPTVRIKESEVETYIHHVKETAAMISQQLS